MIKLSQEVKIWLFQTPPGLSQDAPSPPLLAPAMSGPFNNLSFQGDPLFVPLVFCLKTLVADVFGQVDQVEASWRNVLPWLPFPLQSPSSTKFHGTSGPAVKTGLAVDDHG